MRIAQVSPLFESVPPRWYGGTERVVSNLTEELIRLGHEVTLYATADSVTRAVLVPGAPTGLRLDPACDDPASGHMAMLEQVTRDERYYDVIHCHAGAYCYPFARRWNTPAVSTLHGRLDLRALIPLYREYEDLKVVSISDAQRAPFPSLDWVGTIYHGLPPGLFRAVHQPGTYLAFLGRISPEKRPERAIEIALRVGMPLKIAAKVDGADRDYYEAMVKPLLREPGVEMIGEIGEHEKQAFLGGAAALLFPIDWPEPFGLVMIEALACGTPVLAFRHGSVPEVMAEPAAGAVVSTVDEAVRALPRVLELDRAACRGVFDERFTSARMARDYVEVYRKLIQQVSASREWVA